MQTITKANLPEIKTALPGPKAKQMLERDEKFISPSYTRSYPLVMKRGYGSGMWGWKTAYSDSPTG